MVSNRHESNLFECVWRLVYENTYESNVREYTKLSYSHTLDSYTSHVILIHYTYIYSHTQGLAFEKGKKEKVRRRRHRRNPRFYNRNSQKDEQGSKEENGAIENKGRKGEIYNML